MQRGDVWWSTYDDEFPVVVLSERDAVQIVAAATPEQRRGYVLLAPEEAVEARPTGLAGIEVPLDGLPRPGVVRLALPHQGHIFCTWRLSLTREDLTSYVCRLSPATMSRLELGLRLAEME
ncbi:hypothetical protein AB0J83_32155 [Actinoplanes sp. NPDC049596]|uniref:hypothetical protein n=1 Tax=unclassified Actinoplanes TaxID=2626549 RepID=UPI00343CF249